MMYNGRVALVREGLRSKRMWREAHHAEQWWQGKHENEGRHPSFDRSIELIGKMDATNGKKGAKIG